MSHAPRSSSQPRLHVYLGRLRRNQRFLAMSSTTEPVQEPHVAALKLLAHCKANDWSGHDPYDALNSPIFEALPLMNCRPARLVLTQLLKRSPINIRPLLRIPKTQNPKAFAL